MAKQNYTVSVTDARRKNYPHACRIVEAKGNNLSNMLLGALECIILQNDLEDKNEQYTEWAIEGIKINMEGGKEDG